jgi:hypothetical protein
MADGTLVFAAQFRDAPERGRKPHSTILYSRDHGETWEVGTGAKPEVRGRSRSRATSAPRGRSMRRRVAR